MAETPAEMKPTLGLTGLTMKAMAHRAVDADRDCHRLVALLFVSRRGNPCRLRPKIWSWRHE